MLTVVALALVGVAAGTFGALLGLGGGIFLVPALTLVFDLPIHLAVGTSLTGVIATSAGVASVSRPGRGANVRLALVLEMATTVGAVAGSLLAGRLSARTLTLLFAAIVLLTGVYTVYKTRRRVEPAGEAEVEALFRRDYRVRHWPAGMALSSIAGGLSGLAGVGGGFIKVPVMYAVMGVPLGVATTTSNFMVGITAAASIFVYYSRGDVRPLVAVPTALGVFVGAVLGARLAPRLRAGLLRRGLIVLLFLIAIQMFLKGLNIHASI